MKETRWRLELNIAGVKDAGLEIKPIRAKETHVMVSHRMRVLCGCALLMAAPLAQAEGMEIVDIEFRAEGSRGGKVLRLYLDKGGGPNVEDLSRVSRQLSELLDAEQSVAGPYTLEVSSPGINRPLKTRAHFLRFIGKRVRVRTHQPINGRRSFLGVLQEVQDDNIILAQEGIKHQIPFATIDKSNYEHDWSA